MIARPVAQTCADYADSTSATARRARKGRVPVGVKALGQLSEVAILVDHILVVGLAIINRTARVDNCASTILTGWAGMITCQAIGQVDRHAKLVEIRGELRIFLDARWGVVGWFWCAAWLADDCC